MNVFVYVWSLTSVSLLQQIQLCEGKDERKERNLYCSICQAVVDEIHYRLDEVDIRTYIRIAAIKNDRFGIRKMVEIPYERDHAHLHHMFPEVCESVGGQYGITTTSAGKIGVIRAVDRSGRKLDNGNLGSTDEIAHNFELYCRSVIDENEAAIMELFQYTNMPTDTVKEELCSYYAKACREEDLPGYVVPEHKKKKYAKEDDEVEEMRKWNERLDKNIDALQREKDEEEYEWEELDEPNPYDNMKNCRARTEEGEEVRMPEWDTAPPEEIENQS